MGSRNKKKPVERFKSRKEVRKDKRMQKKQNRVHFQKRKKELKLEFKERMKQTNSGKKGKTNGKSQTAKEKQPFEEIDNKDDSIANEHIDGNGNDDEEIESDFELSDEELEMKTKSISKPRYIINIINAIIFL